MPPRKDPKAVDSDSNALNPIQDLSSVLHELLRAQQHQNPDPFGLDTRIELPMFSEKINGEAVDS